MILPAEVVSILIVLALAAALVITGLRKAPGIGIIAAVVVIVLTLVLRGESLASIGFGAPPSWVGVILLGLVLGIALQLLTISVVEPLTDHITKSKHDHSILTGVKGSWKAFLKWMLLVWILVAFLEEGIYRGFLMTEIARATGTGWLALAANVILTSVVFGLSHGYQGRSGMWSTGIIGAVLAVIFVWSGFNLWLVIFTHGFIDTVGIGLAALGWEDAVRRRISLRFS
jgi:uncharacterized protein